MMLSNRFFRFLTLLLIIVVLGLISWLLFPTFCSTDSAFSSNYVFYPIFVFASAIIFQFFGDILNIGFLNGAIGSFIKRLIFVIVSIALAIFSIAMSSQMFNGGGENLFSLGVFTYMVSSANLIMAPVTCFAYLIGTSQEWDIEICPFFLPAGYFISFLLGVIAGLIGLGNIGVANAFPLLITIACVIGMVIYRFKIGGAFSGDEYQDEASADNLFQARNSYKKTHGATAYHSQSNCTPSSSIQSGDNRKNDKSIILNELNARMNQIANSYSRQITYNSDYIDVHVYSHVYINEIVFEVSANLCMYDDGDRDHRSMEYMNSENYLSQELRQLPNKIKNDAINALRDLQSEYSNYDRNYSIKIRGIR